MVQMMEAWFYADQQTLQGYFGAHFRINALSGRPQIEDISKVDLLRGLTQATRDCNKGEYSKGRHSFQLLALIDPLKVRSASPRASRFLDVLAVVCTP